MVDIGGIICRKAGFGHTQSQPLSMQLAPLTTVRRVMSIDKRLRKDA